MQTLHRFLFAFIPCAYLLLQGCSPNNVTINKDLKKYFDSSNVEGCFGLFDNNTGQFMVYNMPRYKDSAYKPASTFKIVNALVGLETGIIDNERMVIKWDGVVRIYPNGDTAKEWNKDLTMKEAFQVSAIPYFQTIARRIGKDTMQFWLDSLKYGNRKIGGSVDSFWLNNSLKITPDEQLGLVKRLYFNQLGFQRRTQEIVRKVMVQEDNANYKLCYKTGMGYKENGRSIGWVVGWIEENKHPYFFVLNLEGEHNAPIPTIRQKLLMSILKDQAFLLGKR